MAVLDVNWNPAPKQLRQFALLLAALLAAAALWLYWKSPGTRWAAAALLAAIYYLVITPIGVIMRVCGYDPMQRRYDRNAKTYWKRRENQDDTKRYFKQY